MGLWYTHFRGGQNMKYISRWLETRIQEVLKSHPQVSCGIIVYAGDRIYPVATNIYAVPWTAF